MQRLAVMSIQQMKPAMRPPENPVGKDGPLLDFRLNFRRGWGPNKVVQPKVTHRLTGKGFKMANFRSVDRFCQPTAFSKRWSNINYNAQ